MSKVNPQINVRILKSQINMKQSFGASTFANFEKKTFLRNNFLAVT